MGIALAQWRCSIGLFLPRTRTAGNNKDKQCECQMADKADEWFDKDETLKPDQSQTLPRTHTADNNEDEQCGYQTTDEWLDKDETLKPDQSQILPRTHTADNNEDEQCGYQTADEWLDKDETMKPDQSQTLPRQDKTHKMHEQNNAISRGWLRQASECVNILVLLLLVASLLAVLLIRGGVESNPGPSTLEEATQRLAGISVHAVKKKMDTRSGESFGQFIHSCVSDLGPEQEYLLGVYLLNDVNKAQQVIHKGEGHVRIKCHLMDVLHHWMKQRDDTTWDDLLSELASTYPSFNTVAREWITKNNRALSSELEVRHFLCVIDDHPNSLHCKNRDDICRFGLTLGLEYVMVQQAISDQTSSQTTSMAAYGVINRWSQLQPDAPILDLVIALARLLSEKALQDLIEGLLDLGIAPREQGYKPSLPRKPPSHDRRPGPLSAPERPWKPPLPPKPRFHGTSNPNSEPSEPKQYMKPPSNAPSILNASEPTFNFGNGELEELSEELKKKKVPTATLR